MGLVYKDFKVGMRLRYTECDDMRCGCLKEYDGKECTVMHITSKYITCCFASRTKVFAFMARDSKLCESVFRLQLARKWVEI
jgi:hypothetical protein